tara:strand:- start:2400 stop:4739 length:2340 start_codon:yes stop_codon:yes gene_type:complete
MAAPVLKFKRGKLTELPSLAVGEPGFTTDKYDLYLGSSDGNKFVGSGRFWSTETATTGSGVYFFEATDNGTNKTLIQAPASLAADLTYTLPSAQGNANSVLTNNGSGVLTWGAGSSNSVLSGVTTISGSLDVEADAEFSGLTTVTNTTDNTIGNVNTGALQIDGGVGIAKNLTVGAAASVTSDFFVSGISTFVGAVTFQGGTINLGDADTDDINVEGEFISSLVPNADKTYDLGEFDKQWRDVYAGGSVYGYESLVSTEAANTTVTYTVTVASKTSNHRYNGSGSSSGYFIDGSEAPILTLVPGVTYRFTNDNTGSHPLKFYLESDKTTEYTTGVSFQNTYTELTVGDETPAVLHYQCTNHGLMGNAVVTQSNVVNSNYAAILRGGLNVSGAESVLSSATVSDLTDERVVLAGSSGALEDSGNLTFNGSKLTVTGNAQITSDLDVDGGANISGGESVLSSATVSDLTAGRVVLAGTSGALEDSALLTHTGGNGLVVTGNASVSGIATIKQLEVGLPGQTLVGITTILDEDGMGSDSATALATQQSIKAYVDAQVTAQDLDFAGDSGTGAVDLDSQSLTISGTSNEIETSASNQTITIGLPNTVNITTELDVPTIEVTTIESRNGATAMTISDTTGNVAVASTLTVQGDLVVTGAQTIVNTETLKVEDSLIEVGLVNSGGDLVAPTTDANIDVGILFHYHTGSAAKKAAVFWDDSVSRIVFGSDVSETNSVLSATANTGYSGIEIKELYVNDCAGASQVISCTGSTRNLENITIDGGTFT